MFLFCFVIFFSLMYWVNFFFRVCVWNFTSLPTYFCRVQNTWDYLVYVRILPRTHSVWSISAGNTRLLLHSYILFLPFLSLLLFAISRKVHPLFIYLLACLLAYFSPHCRIIKKKWTWYLYLRIKIKKLPSSSDLIFRGYKKLHIQFSQLLLSNLLRRKITKSLLSFAFKLAPLDVFMPRW